MTAQNALYPTGEQFEALLKLPDDKPVCMVNLLKFRNKAAYEDGSDADISGAQAYARYASVMQKYVEESGGRFVFSASVDMLMIGSGDGDWDAVGVVEYPSRKAFIELASSEKVMAIGVHRAAGLEGQLLIATTQGDDALTG